MPMSEEPISPPTTAKANENQDKAGGDGQKQLFCDRSAHGGADPQDVLMKAPVRLYRIVTIETGQAKILLF